MWCSSLALIGAVNHEQRIMFGCTVYVAHRRATCHTSHYTSFVEYHLIFLTFVVCIQYTNAVST